MRKHFTRLFWGLYVIGVIASISALIYVIVARYPDPTRAFMLFALWLAYGIGWTVRGEGE